MPQKVLVLHIKENKQGFLVTLVLFLSMGIKLLPALLEECFYGVANFGYFGRKDKTTHQFDLCEDCYDKMTESFVVPVTEEERTELL